MSVNHPEITGIILVGGKSRRMGQDKTFLEIDGISLFDRVLAALRRNFTRILLVGDREERFAGYHLPLVPDIYPGSSLSGLYTGLYHAETEYVFVCSCDIPFPNPDMIGYLCSHLDGHDVVVPVHPYGYEPLFAVYGKMCLGPMRELLEQENYCVYDLYPHVNVRYATREELAPFDRDGRAFVNVNTPDELTAARKELPQ